MMRSFKSTGTGAVAAVIPQAKKRAAIFSSTMLGVREVPLWALFRFSTDNRSPSL